MAAAALRQLSTEREASTVAQVDSPAAAGVKLLQVSISTLAADCAAAPTQRCSYVDSSCDACWHRALAMFSISRVVERQLTMAWLAAVRSAPDSSTMSIIFAAVLRSSLAMI